MLLRRRLLLNAIRIRIRGGSANVERLLRWVDVIASLLLILILILISSQLLDLPDLPPVMPLVSSRCTIVSRG